MGFSCSLGLVVLSVRGAGGLAGCLPRQLLQHECPRCPERPPFSLFGDLEQHMRKQHELFCCKLCLRHLQVSPPPGAPPPLTSRATRWKGLGRTEATRGSLRRGAGEGREAWEPAHSRAQRPFPADLHA